MNERPLIYLSLSVKLCSIYYFVPQLNESYKLWELGNADIENRSSVITVGVCFPQFNVYEFEYFGLLRIQQTGDWTRESFVCITFICAD